MSVQETSSSATKKSRFFRLFIVLVSFAIGIVLAFPDALTYSKYAALNGQVVQVYYHAHWMRRWIAYGAPIGVYLFALNNMYRFCMLVLKDLYQVRYYNLAVLRYGGFLLITLLAVVSVIPFYGMAYQAGLPLYMVYANSFARFCMNDFAFFFLLNFSLDYFVRVKWPRRFRKTVLIERLMFLVSHNKIDVPDADHSIDHHAVATRMKKNSWRATRFNRKKRRVLRIASILMFSCGLIAGVYLYSFAKSAVNHIMANNHGVWIAVLGIIPTSLLWGHDARYSWITPLRFLFRYYADPERPVTINYSIPIRRSFMVVMAVGIFFVAIPASISEVMMVFKYTADDTVGWVVRIAAIPAFFGIYMAGLVELSIRVFDYMQEKIFPDSTITKRQIYLKSLRQLQLQTLRDRVI